MSTEVKIVRAGVPAGATGVKYVIVAAEIRGLIERCGQVAEVLNDISVKVRRTNELMGEFAELIRDQSPADNGPGSEPTSARAEKIAQLNQAQAELLQQGTAQLLALVSSGASALATATKELLLALHSAPTIRDGEWSPRSAAPRVFAGNDQVSAGSPIKPTVRSGGRG